MANNHDNDNGLGVGCLYANVGDLHKTLLNKLLFNIQVSKQEI